MGNIITSHEDIVRQSWYLKPAGSRAVDIFRGQFIKVLPRILTKMKPDERKALVDNHGLLSGALNDYDENNKSIYEIVDRAGGKLSFGKRRSKITKTKNRRSRRRSRRSRRKSR